MKNARRLLGLFLISIFMYIGALNVFAEDHTASLPIPVSIVLEGNIPAEKDAFEICLVPKDSSMPLPVDGTSSITIMGEGTDNFPEIVFTIPGIYEYSLNQAVGDAPCKYDETIYQLKVYITNGDKGLEMTTVVYQNEENDKVSMPVFCNIYLEKETEKNDSTDIVGTGDSSNLTMNYLVLVISFVIMVRLLWVEKNKKENE